MFFKSILKRKKEKKDPRDDITSIGNILLTMGEIDRPTLDFLLRDQQESDFKNKIGDLAVIHGFITKRALDESLKWQELIRKSQNKHIILAEIARCNIEKNRKVAKKREALNTVLMEKLA